MGPQLGWINGWAIFVADVIVMASLSVIAGLYTFKLVGLVCRLSLDHSDPHRGSHLDRR